MAWKRCIARTGAPKPFGSQTGLPCLTDRDEQILAYPAGEPNLQQQGKRLLSETWTIEPLPIRVWIVKLKTELGGRGSSNVCEGHWQVVPVKQED
jgi:hypothetical protein